MNYKNVGLLSAFEYPVFYFFRKEDRSNKTWLLSLKIHSKRTCLPENSTILELFKDKVKGTNIYSPNLKPTGPIKHSTESDARPKVENQDPKKDETIYGQTFSLHSKKIEWLWVNGNVSLSSSPSSHVTGLKFSNETVDDRHFGSY